MATDFKYAAQTDLEMYYPSFSEFDTKRQIFNWTEVSTSLYAATNTGLITRFFVNGDEKGDAESTTPDANNEWKYYSGGDYVQWFSDSIDPRDNVMEAGIDNATYFDQMLVNASMELNNMLSKRFTVPIPKVYQFDYDSQDSAVGTTTQYDAIIIKATCYLCVANLLRTNGRQEEADYYYSMVTNMDGSGIVDRLNKGDFKLSYEVDANDDKGKIREITKSGTMDIIEVGGAYTGYPYELLEIECTTSGAYGVGKFKVSYYGSDKLLGDSREDIVVTGQLQEIHNGWYCRFAGASMADGDKWQVDLYSASRDITNAESGSVQLTRRGYSI